MADRDLFLSLEAPARRLLEAFAELTPIQREVIPRVLDHEPLLIIAPTAAGKTEAALAPLVHLRSVERWSGQPTILCVVPTRALINDLHRRLRPVLRGFLEVGRRTGEYRETGADLLLTTPESLDSMLARRHRRGGHYLSSVRAVVLDELHLLADRARGTQLNLLLARLDQVTSQPALRLALSATISDAPYLAKRFLGPQAGVGEKGAGRALDVIRATTRGPLGARPEHGPDPIARQLPRLPVGRAGHRALATRLRALREDGPLKALVFVRSRARCDTLAAGLRKELEGVAPISVVGHHGSLSRPAREAAERELATAPESIAVATMTLEIGIDIGDINLVVLDGAPLSVSSLLQRVGRANRRERTVRVLPLAKSSVDACIMASMLRAAADGDLDEERRTAHYSVAIQQLASMLLLGERGRTTSTKLQSLWSAEYSPQDTDLILTELAREQWLRQRGEVSYGPGDQLAELGSSPIQLHGNIDSGGSMLPVVDRTSGDTIAWVPKQSVPEQIALAGRTLKGRRTREAIEVWCPQDTHGEGDPLRYATRRAPVLRSALRHLALGLGLGENALVRQGQMWIHFGGALYSQLLGLAGVEGTPLASIDDPRGAIGQPLEKRLERGWGSVEALCGFGPHQRNLPVAVRKKAVLASLPLDAYRGWLHGFEEVALTGEQRSLLLGRS